MALTIEALLEVTSASRRTRRLLPRITAGMDLVVILLATALATLGRAQLPWFAEADDLTRHVQTGGIAISLTWMVLLAASGSYRSAIFGAGTDEYRLVLNASLGTAGLVGIGSYLTQFPLSRGFFVLLFLVGTPGLLLSRFAIRRGIQQLRRQGSLVQRVLIAGTQEHVDDVAAVLGRESWLGYSVEGCLLPGEASDRPHPYRETPSGIPILGTTGDAARLVEQAGADVIIFGGGAFASAAETRQAALDLEHLPELQIVVAPSLTDVAGDRIQVRPVAGLPLVHLERPRWRDAAHWAKRAFDVVVAGGLLVAAAPLSLLLIAWIKLTDGGPAFFSQIRVGRDGQLFRCWKLRSMVVDAEQRLAALTPDQQEHVLFKQQEDPRITRPGRLIRRYSIDELPQLWNVLRGEMSLVGPRPALPVEVSRYDDGMRRRLHVRPGMTGLWQVSGRSDLSWNDTVRLDLYYVDNWSMIQDLVIMMRTFSAVFAARGAY